MSNIGKPFSRVDGLLKVTGQARYTAEIQLPRLAYASLVQSTIACGRIRSLDSSQAEALPGALAVITHQNAERLSLAAVALDMGGRQRTMGSAGESLLPLQDERVYYNGQHIAMVIAESLEQASYAASLVQVEYEEETPVLTTAAGESRAFTPENVWSEPAVTQSGDAQVGLAQADVVGDHTYITANQNHTTMEPHATIAVWEGDHLTVYEPSTWVYGVRNALSQWFSLPVEHVRVIQYFVGGSFGAKGPTWPHVALTAMAARHVGRPVRLVLTRQQEFVSAGYRPEIEQRIVLGAKRDGTLTTIMHYATVQNSIFDTRAVAPVTKTTRKLYACPNVETRYRLVPLNVPGPFTMRGPGETPGLFAVECAMDELAYALAMDPIELRLHNYAEVDPEIGHPWSSKSLRECYRQGAERFGWHARNPHPRSMRQGEYLKGWGMATMAYDAKSSPASALTRLFADGRVLVQSATCDQGTGSYTTMCQIAADALDLPFEQIRFELGDTQMPMAPISAGSMTSASVGSAVHASATSLRRKLVEMAVNHPQSPLRGQREEWVRCVQGRLFVQDEPATAISYTDILKLYRQPQMEVIEQVKPDEAAQGYSCYAFGAHFAEVLVDPESGEVCVSRFVGAFGAGRILNAKTAYSQLSGGIIWGIGMALMEQMLRDPRTGHVLNDNLAEYHVPVNADIPPIDAFFVDEHDEHVNMLGVKGIGELGTVGAAAAVANAVYHATGNRIRQLPITPDKF